MNYVKTEQYKIKKSWQGLLGYILVFCLVVAVIIGYKIQVDLDISSLDIVLLSLGNINNSLVLHFAVSLISSLLFAGEFTYKTYKYIMIRPVSLYKLFISKLLAIWYYSFKIIIFIAILSYILGIIFCGAGLVVHGQNYIVLDNGLLRVILFYIGTWVNMLFIITLSIFFSVLFKNQVTTVIGSIGLLLILIMVTNIMPNDILNYTPLGYFNLRSFFDGINIQWMKFSTGLFINILYSVVILELAFLYLKNKDILI